MSTISDLLQGTGAVVQQNATTYLVAQYAKLSAVPARMDSVVQRIRTISVSNPVANRALRDVQQAASGLVADATQVVASASDVLRQLAPQMQTGQIPVNALLNVSLVAQLAGVALDTQTILTRADTVDSNLRDVVQQLQTTGNLTANEASSLLQSSSSTTRLTRANVYWYVLGGVAVLWLLTRRKA